MVTTYDWLRSPTSDPADGEIIRTGTAQQSVMTLLDAAPDGTWWHGGRKVIDGTPQPWLMVDSPVTLGPVTMVMDVQSPAAQFSGSLTVETDEDAFVTMDVQSPAASFAGTIEVTDAVYAGHITSEESNGQALVTWGPPGTGPDTFTAGSAVVQGTISGAPEPDTFTSGSQVVQGTVTN